MCTFGVDIRASDDAELDLDVKFEGKVKTYWISIFFAVFRSASALFPSKCRSSALFRVVSVCFLSMLSVSAVGGGDHRHEYS